MRKTKCIYASVLLFFLTLFGWAEDGGIAVTRSIVVVFDLSYSMNTTDGNSRETRYDLGKKALEKIISTAREDEEWSLIISDDADTAVAVNEFTQEPQSMLSFLKDAQPWGTTSIDTMILAGARRFEQAAGGTDRFLLLITDGIQTDGLLYQLREFYVSEVSRIVPVVLGFEISEYESMWRHVSHWATSSGGYFLFHNQTNQLRAILNNGDELSASAAIETVAEAEILEPQKKTRTYRTEIETISFPVWWIFLIPAAAAVGLAVFFFSKWYAARFFYLSTAKKARDAITIACSVYDGEVRRYTFDQFPVKVAGRGNADLLLERPRINSGARSFLISRENDTYKFSANGMFIINGVGRRTRVLSNGDRINFGRYRITFEGVSRVTTPPPPVPAPRFLFFIPAIFACIALSVFFREPVKMERKKRVEVESAAVSIEHERSNGRVKIGGLGAELAAVDPAMEEQEDGGDVKDPGPIVIQPPPEEPAINTFPTVMWAPEETPDFFKVDALLFHAHPDDETLDFGVLLRRLADSGKRTAVVLFTDGNAGLDQYPRREVTESYPAYDLKGDQLAAVRAVEARAAMSILGVNHYVRLGRENNPYAGVDDVLSVEAVTAAWGGEDQLIGTIASLITGYRPDIVVSPEGPSAALEHFEHETVGILVEAALKKLEREDEYTPFGRFVSVDPLQRGLYPDAVGIRADMTDSGCGLTYRAVQAAALAEHRTQRDAAVVGVENLSGFDREYYEILSWKFPFSIEEYLNRD